VSESAPQQALPPLAPEDEARGNVYGLLARLFYAAPHARLLDEIRGTGAGADKAQLAEGDAGDRAFEAAWTALADACRDTSPAALESEHLALFGGAGKSEVTPYLSHYVLRHESDTPLSELRGELLRFGIARRPGVSEYEDHVSALCETMRYVVAVQRRDLDEQGAFFERFVYPGAVGFCNAILASEHAHFYKFTARWALVFLEIERRAFTIT